jgi:hypothetical protein
MDCDKAYSYEPEKPEPANGDCPHCGANWWIRCIPPRDHRQCGYYLAKQAKRDCECGSTPDEDLWDIWWAWYPVRIKPRGWAWLRYVWTRRGERRAMS